MVDKEAALSERDCMWPDCLIRVGRMRACEHSCPFETKKF